MLIGGLVYCLVYEYVKINAIKIPTWVVCSRNNSCHRGRRWCVPTKSIVQHQRIPLNDKILDSDIPCRLKPCFKSLCLSFQRSQRCIYLPNALVYIIYSIRESITCLIWTILKKRKRKKKTHEDRWRETTGDTHSIPKSSKIQINKKEKRNPNCQVFMFSPNWFLIMSFPPFKCKIKAGKEGKKKKKI